MKIFNPVKSEKLVISIRLASDILKKVDKLSVQAGISRNEFIVQCIQYSIKDLKKS